MPSGSTASQTLGPSFLPIPTRPGGDMLQFRGWHFSFCKGNMGERDCVQKCINTAHQETNPAANASWTLKLSHDIVDYTQTVLSASFR